eukprot:TRINITY_DN36484_c0_g1_i2.p1 TRINITY_DN36484_c0_g1~~TRINITY_DN36484_c0_g1_i2.p1  ORF type:complete len:252 (+),score=16.62 TRINITY_DN36484_c0_g1_i2:72-827(+)
MMERYDDVMRKIHLWTHFYSLYIDSLQQCEHLQERRKKWLQRLLQTAEVAENADSNHEYVRQRVKRKAEYLSNHCPETLYFTCHIVRTEKQQQSSESQQKHKNKKSNFLNWNTKQIQKNWCLKQLREVSHDMPLLRAFEIRQQKVYSRLREYLQQVVVLHDEILESCRQQQKLLQILRFLGDQSTRHQQLGLQFTLPFFSLQQDFSLNYYAQCWFNEEKLDAISKECDENDYVDMESLKGGEIENDDAKLN